MGSASPTMDAMKRLFALASRLPRPPGAETVPSRLFTPLYNHWARGQSLRESLVALEGKRIHIRVTDMPLRLYLLIASGKLQAASAQLPPHLTLRGKLLDFWRLATRAEDPDTLFFERRLAVEGETETGLAMKNALDALDWDWTRHVRAVLPLLPAEALIALGRRLRP